MYSDLDSNRLPLEENQTPYLYVDIVSEINTLLWNGRLIK
jgi:hypothetical protein